MALQPTYQTYKCISKGEGYVCAITWYSSITTYNKRKKGTYYYSLPTSWPQLVTILN